MAWSDLKEMVMYDDQNSGFEEFYIPFFDYIKLLNIVKKENINLFKTTILIIILRGDLRFLVTKFKGGLLVKGNRKNEGNPKGGQMDKGKKAF